MVIPQGSYPQEVRLAIVVSRAIIGETRLCPRAERRRAAQGGAQRGPDEELKGDIGRYWIAGERKDRRALDDGKREGFTWLHRDPEPLGPTEIAQYILHIVKVARAHAPSCDDEVGHGDRPGDAAFGRGTFVAEATGIDGDTSRRIDSGEQHGAVRVRNLCTRKFLAVAREFIAGGAHGDPRSFSDRY